MDAMRASRLNGVPRDHACTGIPEQQSAIPVSTERAGRHVCSTAVTHVDAKRIGGEDRGAHGGLGLLLYPQAAPVLAEIVIPNGSGDHHAFQTELAAVLPDGPGRQRPHVRDTEVGDPHLGVRQDQGVLGRSTEQNGRLHPSTTQRQRRGDCDRAGQPVCAVRQHHLTATFERGHERAGFIVTPERQRQGSLHPATLSTLNLENAQPLSLIFQDHHSVAARELRDDLPVAVRRGPHVQNSRIDHVDVLLCGRRDLTVHGRGLRPGRGSLRRPAQCVRFRCGHGGRL